MCQLMLLDALLIATIAIGVGISSTRYTIVIAGVGGGLEDCGRVRRTQRMQIQATASTTHLVIRMVLVFFLSFVVILIQQTNPRMQRTMCTMVRRIVEVVLVIVFRIVIGVPVARLMCRQQRHATRLSQDVGIGFLLEVKAIVMMTAVVRTVVIARQDIVEGEWLTLELWLQWRGRLLQSRLS